MPHAEPHSATLVLLCKRPAPGHGKQRLAATLGSDAAWRVARLLLHCALEDLASWDGPVVIAPDKPVDVDWATSLLSRDVTVVPQPSGNLGQRINKLDLLLRSRGHQQLLWIGSDCPALMPHHLHWARDTLGEQDIALLPASDGGVVLMANRHPWPALEMLPWSQENFARQLETVCRQHNFGVRFGEQLSDIDSEQDLLLWQHSQQVDARLARQLLRSHLRNRQAG